MKAYCIQLNSQNDVKGNFNTIKEMALQCGGADIIALPEHALFMCKKNSEWRGAAAEIQEIIPDLQNLAVKLGTQILLGSYPYFPHENSAKFFNRCLLIGKDGAIKAYYDKINLYDAILPNGEVYKESDTAESGNQHMVSGNIGLSVCYDIRFSGLYSQLVREGAEIITIPAAFTDLTGKAHWHVLTRARAIETCCYVLAPAQCGVHPSGRRTFGHSMIISPWGEIMAEASYDLPEIIFAELDMNYPLECRRRLGLER
jgi:deaminated glutathione amidase